MAVREDRNAAILILVLGQLVGIRRASIHPMSTDLANQVRTVMESVMGRPIGREPRQQQQETELTHGCQSSHPSALPEIVCFTGQGI